MTDKPMSAEEVAAILYPHSPSMREKYIRARNYAAAVPRRVIPGKLAEPQPQFFVRTMPRELV